MIILKINLECYSVPRLPPDNLMFEIVLDDFTLIESYFDCFEPRISIWRLWQVSALFSFYLLTLLLLLLYFLVIAVTSTCSLVHCVARSSTMFAIWPCFKPSMYQWSILILLSLTPLILRSFNKLAFCLEGRGSTHLNDFCPLKRFQKTKEKTFQNVNIHIFQGSFVK